jgi:hypothetical protein
MSVGDCAESRHYRSGPKGCSEEIRRKSLSGMGKKLSRNFACLVGLFCYYLLVEPVWVGR